MNILIGVAVCCAPFVILWLGYLWGRYGLPIEMRRRRMTDRRRKSGIEETVATEEEVYRV